MQKEKRFDGRNVVFGVCSSIAAYKACDIVSALVRGGARVSVIMTENACKLVSPRIFQTLSRNKVYVSMWEKIDEWKPEHISLAESADLFLVAPATANIIGKFACDIADDMLTSTYLATKAKVLIAPAMNSNMLSHAAVRRNIETLRRDGAAFVGPDEGALACGAEGKGRLASDEKILDAAWEALNG